jgi:hypothetical protein
VTPNIINNARLHQSWSCSQNNKHPSLCIAFYDGNLPLDPNVTLVWVKFDNLHKGSQMQSPLSQQFGQLLLCGYFIINKVVDCNNNKKKKKKKTTYTHQEYLNHLILLYTIWRLIFFGFGRIFWSSRLADRLL